MTEAQLLTAVTNMATAARVFWFHDPDSRKNPGPPGFPDLVLGRGWRVIWRELKTEVGTMSPEQRAWGRLLVDAGQDFAVWRPRDLHSGTIAHTLTELGKAPQ
jgi:hypothetical protein